MGLSGNKYEEGLSSHTLFLSSGSYLVLVHAPTNTFLANNEDAQVIM